MPRPPRRSNDAAVAATRRSNSDQNDTAAARAVLVTEYDREPPLPPIDTVFRQLDVAATVPSRTLACEYWVRLVENSPDGVVKIVRHSGGAAADAASDQIGTIRRRRWSRALETGGARVRQTWCDLFLPVGYPQTVRSGYLQYQCYDSLQGLCSYLRGVWCHAAVLEAAGVGHAEASAWGAAITSLKRPCRRTAQHLPDSEPRTRLILRTVCKRLRMILSPPSLSKPPNT
jgi:Vitamin B6 photo-protection and homoeostasis